MGPSEHDLAGLVDLRRVQRMCDSLSAAFGIGLAVLDPAGTVLVSSGWQDICTRFHRLHAETLRGCLESDLRINRRLVEGLGADEHYAYQCANGLWDVAFALVVAGEHLANIYTGQFFFDDDDVDQSVFVARARRLGFDERAYLEALARVPVLSHESVTKSLAFLADFVGMLGEMGLTALQREQKHEELEETEKRYRQLFDNATEGLIVFRVVRNAAGEVGDLEIVDLNPVQAARTHTTREQMVGRLMNDGGEENLRLRTYFALVADAIASGRSAHGELADEAEGRFELLTVYPAGHELWALAARDVTDARKAEQALRRQEEDIRRAYVNVLDAVTGGKLILLTEEGLAGELGPPLSDVRPIGSAAQLGEARRIVVDAAERCYPGQIRHIDLLSPVCEALDNALNHAEGGTYQVFTRNGCLQVAVSDEGPGIDFGTLPRATLVRGFSTAASLGMGFTIMLQLCARVLLCTRPGRTQVVLEVAAGHSPTPRG
jgi:ligand-binding sensor protein/anti-sigma regulatory factor (Ser/Thr protein kinase)